MKFFIATFFLFFSYWAFAKQSKDLAQLLRESKCVPTRSRTGKVSYKCDGTLGAELAAQRTRSQTSKPLTQARKPMQPVQSRQPASDEQQNEIVTAMPSQEHPTDAKIKSCLASIYQNQVQHHQSRGKYTTVTEDMGIDRNETCNGLYIYTNVANEKEFKITAQFGKNVWTVDQSRNIMKIR